MSREAFLEKLRAEVGAAPLSEIDELRRSIVRAGKHSPKLQAIAYAKGLTDDPKYFNPDDDKETGAIDTNDALLLYSLVRMLRPKNIVEVGTWFGTSAAAMAKGGDVTVYTCDRNDVYVRTNAWACKIRYHQSVSSQWLRCLKDSGIRAQMAFIDANLKDIDPKLLRRILDGGSPIVLHDFSGDLKGVRNWRILRHHFKELELVRPKEMPKETECLAMLVPKDYQ